MSALAGGAASPQRRLSHTEAIARLRALAVPVRPSERVAVFDAAGRVSAEPVLAPRSIPTHANASVDGYAFAFADYDAERGALLALAGRAAAGAPSPTAARPGSAVRVCAGAVMPEGCDTVAMREDCRLERGGAFVAAGLDKVANRRLAGGMRRAA